MNPRDQQPGRPEASSSEPQEDEQFPVIHDLSRRTFTVAALAGAAHFTIGRSPAHAGVTKGEDMEKTSQPDGLTVPARVIPVPRTSPQAQAFLKLSGELPYQSLPDPSDIPAWKKHLTAANARLTQMTQSFADAHPGTVTVHKLPSCSLYEVTPSTFRESNADKAIFYTHGGSFTNGWGIAAAHMAHPLAGITGLRAYSVDYRMPPDHPFPAGLEDAVEAYRFVLDRHKPSAIAVAGGSAGAGLAASLILKARDLGLPLPAACVLASPEADLTESGDSFRTNEFIDVVLKHGLTNAIRLYAGGHDLTIPYLSPLFGDFTKGFPPTLLTAGTRDLFLSNAVRFHRALRRASIESELHVWEAMPHGGFFGAPEDAESHEEQARFIRHFLRAM